MTTAGWILLAAVAALVLGIVLEGRRQGRRHARRGTGERLLRIGLMELHAMLEPERKIERLVEEEDQRTLPALPGEPPLPGGAGTR